jgi:outer membrane protein assembly factor BamB
MRRAAALLLAVAAAAAPDSEPDAAVAEPARWVEPRGCASGSFRSRALPVVTEIEEAWQLSFESVDAPPVHWDGIGYVVARAGGKPHLVAFDLATGKERARVVIRGFLRGSPLLVWDHLAMLQPDEEQITGYRLSGKRLEVAWTYRGRTDARPRLPVVHDNEIYCLLGDSLARIRPGASSPSWTKYKPEAGALAVYGGHVFVASFGDPWEAQTGQQISDLSLSVFRRSDGGEVRSAQVCQAVHDSIPPKLSLMVSDSQIYVGAEWRFLAEDGYASHAIVPVSSAGDAFTLGRPGMWTCRVPPSHHPKEGTLLLSTPRKGRGLEWCADRGGRIYKLAAETEQPECFKDMVSPTVLGAVVYFGSWAADVDTGEILWRLPVQRVTCAAVPADGLVMVVDEGRTLRAFRGREKR